ncbi:MAG TPA: dTDP-4-dehydrorhamnose reductase [Tepidisphaeraceae bacterium]|jgi:dTDP-4-dehydrorhamnose reductase
MAIYDSILITGGKGMLAQALDRSIQARAKKATLLGRQELDVSDEDSVGSAFAQYRPTLVLNCAAYTKVDKAEEEKERAYEVNGEAVGILAAKCKEYGARLVHYSTDFVFDGRKREPYVPADVTNPQSVYGASKLEGERQAGDEALVIRTAWLYGPGGACFPQTMVGAAKQKKPLTVVNDQVGSPTFTHDLAEATLRLVDAEAKGIFHVTNAGSVSWFDFTRAILEEFHEKADLSPITSAAWKEKRPNSATRPSYSVLDVSEYERATGQRMRPWRQALREYRLEVARAGF